MARQLEGAIFDMDGTLLDSMFIWDTIGESYLRSLGLEPRENLHDVLQSMSLRQAARYYRAEYGVTLSEEEILQGVNGMLWQYYRYEAPLKPGVAGLLSRLREKGVKLAVATATDRPLAEAALARLGVLPLFSGLFTCTEVGRGKEDPLIFEAALRFLGTRREQTLVFEDALYAIRTAKAAGFPVAAVYDRYEAGQAQVRQMADFYFEVLSGPEVWEKLALA